MKHAVLMGNPLFFRIKSGRNPHTRTAWGFRKKVDAMKAFEQWKIFKEILESLGAHVFVLQPQKEYPSMVFPANAGFLYPRNKDADVTKKTFYLSKLTEHREAEALVYHQFFTALGVEVKNLSYAFEGEADFFPCGEEFIFTYGDLVPMGFRPRWGLPPWRYQFSHRTDERNKDELKRIIGDGKLVPVRLVNTRFYHGDTALFPFGENREHLLAYLDVMDLESRARLKKHFGRRLIPLSEKDGENFVANSFQLDTPKGPHLILPAAVSDEVTARVRALGCDYTKVDVSEFFQKGGGSIKCLLCDLGPYKPKPKS